MLALIGTYAARMGPAIMRQDGYGLSIRGDATTGLLDDGSGKVPRAATKRNVCRMATKSDQGDATSQLVVLASDAPRVSEPANRDCTYQGW